MAIADIKKQTNFPEESYLIPTKNNQGFMTTKLDPYSEQFVNFAASNNDWTLEIGTAYGVATVAAIKAGAKVIANDLDRQHLDILKSNIPRDLMPQLKTIPGKFPDDLLLPPNTLSAILTCRVLHFMGPNEFSNSLMSIFELLSPGGKAFIVVDTPFMGWWQKCINEFYTRKKAGDMWPGVFNPAYKYCSEHSIHDLLPSLVHWFDLDVLQEKVIATGFNIASAGYIDRKGVYPNDICLDGRESVGVIAVKPSNMV
jgi:SAM-dependent methyltransferase